ncbi:MAG TPA: hypothetical protein PKW80_10445 [Bacteroidales bacterium]|nr:hypothetical protein [Bacteroidales bacterium]
MLQEIEELKLKNFIHRNARLMWEWETIDKRLGKNNEISYIISERNADGLPVVFEITYHIRSFCGILEKDKDGLEYPVFADKFIMRIIIPNNYPTVGSKLVFTFLTEDNTGQNIPHPWHPNIRYYGDFAGKVCLNELASGTYTDLALYIDRVALYLKYEKYHASVIDPPYPEDDIVAHWVVQQAEPKGWIDDLKKYKTKKP